jgi:hypothetical protein
MSEKIYIKDYWGDRDLVIGVSSTDKDLVAIGEVLDNNGERYIHINAKELIRCLILLNVFRGELSK